MYIEHVLDHDRHQRGGGDCPQESHRRAELSQQFLMSWLKIVHAMIQSAKMEEGDKNLMRGDPGSSAPEYLPAL